MQFHIPQHLEIEDKLFGPLTLKQAIYVAGGAGGAFLIYKLIHIVAISAPLIVMLGVLTWALAFYPKEKLGKPFIEILEAGLGYIFSNKLYTWKKTAHEEKLGIEKDYTPSQSAPAPMVPSGKLASTSFGLDVRNSGKDQDERDRK